MELELVAGADDARVGLYEAVADAVDQRLEIGIGVAMALAGVSAAYAEDDPRHRWKMHSAFGSKVAILGPAGVRVSDNITKLSKDTVRVKFFEPGALVPGVQYFDPVSSGSLDSAWGSPGYHMGQNTAYGFFTAVPFGPGYGEFFAWKAGSRFSAVAMCTGSIGISMPFSARKMRTRRGLGAVRVSRIFMVRAL